jgi:hypothetical protein
MILGDEKPCMVVITGVLINPRISERQKIKIVMDDIKTISLLHQVADVQAFQHLGILLRSSS